MPIVFLLKFVDGCNFAYVRGSTVLLCWILNALRLLKKFYEVWSMTYLEQGYTYYWMNLIYKGDSRIYLIYWMISNNTFTIDCVDNGGVIVYI